MLYVLKQLTAFAFMALSVRLAGEAILRRLRPLDAELLGGARSLAVWVVGWGVWTAALFVLAAAQMLRTWSLIAVVAGPVVFVAWDAFRRRAAVRADGLDAFRPSSEAVLGTTIFAGLLTPFFLLLLSPVVSTDAAVYHLTLPKAYWQAGGFRAVEMSVYSNWPLGVELLMLPALALQGFVLAKSVHFLFGALALYALYSACRRAGLQGSAAWIAMALFLANDVVGFEFRSAHVELAQAFFLLSGFVFLLDVAEHGIESSKGRTHLLYAGVSAGLLAGTKVTGIVDAALLGLLCCGSVWSASRRGEGRVAVRAALLRFVLPIVLLWSPWLVKAWWATGNPAYPLLHGMFGGPDWSASLQQQFSDWQRSIGMGREPRDYLLLPLRVVLLGGRGYERFDGEIGLFWLLLIPFAVVFGIRRAPARRALTIAGLHFVFWALSSQQMRFLVPILPLLAFAAAVPLSEGLERLPKGRRIAASSAVVLALFLVLNTHAEIFQRTPRQIAALLTAPIDLERTATPEVFRRIDAELPQEARLLFLGYNQGFFCPREYLADSFFEASQINDWLSGASTPEEVLKRLRERGLTHVLLDRRLRIPYPRPLQEILANPATARLMFSAQEERFLVFELRVAERSEARVERFEAGENSSGGGSKMGRGVE